MVKRTISAMIDVELVAKLENRIAGKNKDNVGKQHTMSSEVESAVRRYLEV
jgi:hypothetical protein